LPVYQYSIHTDFVYKNFKGIKSLIDKIIREEKYYPGSIAVVFTDDDYLIEINKEYLEHDFYTDIITFDYSERGVINGDLIISIDRIKENSLLYNNSLIDEVDRVIIHGILHLVGYNDRNDDDVLKMREKENFYLELRKGD